MRRRVDLWLLGTALAAAFVSGLAALWVSERHVAPVIWAHDAAGMVVLALVWSKLRVIRRGLVRRLARGGGLVAAAPPAARPLGSRPPPSCPGAGLWALPAPCVA